MKTLFMTLLLVYYGWPSSFNYTTNVWDTSLVSQDMSAYNMIVLGNGLQSPTHGDHINTITIVNNIKSINPDVKIFGYVTTNQTYVSFVTAATEWNDNIGVDGIFMDEAGYDFGDATTNGREAFNAKVDFVHSLSDANICFANAWNIEHVMGLDNDVSYPNTIYNPNSVVTNLTQNDWYLFENFAVMNSDVEDQSQYMSRGDLASKYSAEINMAAVSIISNDAQDAQDLFNFSYVGSFLWDIDSHGSSDVFYGASSSLVNFWDRPDVSMYTPKVVSKRTLCYRDYDGYRLKLNFSTTSVITVNK